MIRGTPVHLIPDLFPVLRITTQQIAAGKFMDDDLGGIGPVIGLTDAYQFTIGGYQYPTVVAAGGSERFNLDYFYVESALLLLKCRLQAHEGGVHNLGAR